MSYSVALPVIPLSPGAVHVRVKLVCVEAPPVRSVTAAGGVASGAITPSSSQPNMSINRIPIVKMEFHHVGEQVAFFIVISTDPTFSIGHLPSAIDGPFECD
jgi:hypothetical protein